MVLIITSRFQLSEGLSDDLHIDVAGVLKPCAMECLADGDTIAAPSNN